MSEEKTPWNPSRKAIARVKSPLPVPETCPTCGEEVEVAHHEDIYGRAYSDWPWAYLCRPCDAYVGMHPFTDIPLGTLADRNTRRLRKVAKNLFHEYLNRECIDRSEGYEVLARDLGITTDQCHFGWFNEDQCERASEALRARLTPT